MTRMCEQRGSLRVSLRGVSQRVLDSRSWTVPHTDTPVTTCRHNFIYHGRIHTSFNAFRLRSESPAGREYCPKPSCIFQRCSCGFGSDVSELELPSKLSLKLLHPTFGRYTLPYSKIILTIEDLGHPQYLLSNDFNRSKGIVRTILKNL